MLSLDSESVSRSTATSQDERLAQILSTASLPIPMLSWKSIYTLTVSRSERWVSSSLNSVDFAVSELTSMVATSLTSHHQRDTSYG